MTLTLPSLQRSHHLPAMRIVTIVGARPQFIKAAPVSAELRRVHEEVLVHTGQHFDPGMSDVFFDELGIPAPDHHRGISGGSHGAMVGRMLERIEQVLIDTTPDLVLVYGDTNSTLAGALAAAKLRVRLAHVEAGLRSFDRGMPEEINRVLTDHASHLLFCPGLNAVENLAAEGITKGVHDVGDVMLDALRAAVALGSRRSAVLERNGLREKGYVLATIHRQENTDDRVRLAAILDGLAAVDESVALPLHPRTQAAIARHGLRVSERIQVLDPLGHVDMVSLEAAARVIVTDSGGVQKEAYWLGVPCVTLRDATEWVETVTHGWNRLVGPDAMAIAHAVATAQRPARHPALYGEPGASARIAALVDS